MKTVILSDIHSNIHALEAIVNHEKGCDQIYCAGDLVDYGPNPQEVIQWVQANQIPCVQGNHDHWVCKNYRNGNFLESVPADERAWVHHNAALLTEPEIAFLEQLPKAMTFDCDGVTYGLTHLYRDYDEIVSLYEFEQFCEATFATSIDRLIIGHTHWQAIRYLSDSLLWLNPGSVSYRRAGDPDRTAHYVVITDGRMSLKRLDYDVTAVYHTMRQVPLKASEKRFAERNFGRRNK